MDARARGRPPDRTPRRVMLLTSDQLARVLVQVYDDDAVILGVLVR
jgi:hypothetical protein